MYKMITIDVDDTLLNDEHQVTAGTKRALAQAVEKGVFVTLATGRMYASAKQIASQIELNVPIITSQGSLVKNLEDEKVLYERFVPKDMASYLFDYAQKHQLHVQAYYGDKLVAVHDNEKIKRYSEFSMVPYQIQTKEEILEHSLTKLLFYEDPELLDRIAADLSKEIGDKLHITKSKPFFLEFLHKEGTKGHAVSFLAKHHGCSLKEVIAIGDSWNDHEMIEIAGLGVAMENAVPSLKSIADFITKSNNEEGVKHVIETFVL